jgi:hypothetical protein
MDALETALVECLSTANADADVPRDLAWRVLSTVRRRRRRRTAIVSAVLVAVMVTVPVTLSAREPQRAPLADLGGAPADQPAEFEALVDRASARPGVPVAQRGGEFRMEALGAAGLLVGGVGIGVDTWSAAGDKVGTVDRGTTGVRWLTDSGRHWVRAAGDDLVGWATKRDAENASRVFCAALHDDWQPVEVGTTGASSTPGRALFADATIIAWTDDAGEAWSSQECRMPQRVGTGNVVAVSWPTVYLRTVDGVYSQVDLVAGATVPLAGVPASASFFAASGETHAWVDDNRMFVSTPGGVRDFDGCVPTGGVFELTVGHRLVVCSTRRATADDAVENRAVVIDPISGVRVELGSEAYVAGDLIAWREGDHYLVAPVR